MASRRPSRRLSINLDAEEETPKFNPEASIVIGETTLRKDGFSINSAGVWLSPSEHQSNDDDASTDNIMETIDQHDLENVATLGRGASGQVIKVRHKPTGNFYAVKVAYNVYNKAKRDQMLTEIKTLYSIRSPWLVTCNGAFFKDNSISVILELCDMGSLDSVVSKFGAIPERVLAAMTFQMLCGLSYLRNRHRFHRDIKPQNILLKTDGHVKLTDFGLAKELENSLQMASTFVGTFKYMSPERIKSDPYNFKSDIWSLGLVLLESVSAEAVYPGAHSHIDLVQSILESPVPAPPNDKYSPEFEEFLSCCLQKDPEKRLSAEILLGSPWLELQGACEAEKCVETVREWIDSVRSLADEKE